jgi:hypothetical protein
MKIHNGYLAIYSARITKILALGLPARAVVPFPFCIVFRDQEQEKMDWIVRHEKIHFRQQLELLWVGQIILSFMEKFYSRIFLHKTRMEAYKSCSFEQETYLNQHDLEYLENRPLFRSFYYIKHKKKFEFVIEKPGEIRMLE